MAMKNRGLLGLKRSTQQGTLNLLTKDVTSVSGSDNSENKSDSGGKVNDLNCIFCFTAIPFSSTQSQVLENVVPYGQDLKIRLDSPRKNKEAFVFLCKELNVECSEEQCEKGTLTYQENNCLPLCFKCQNLYQEMYQLQVQIMELKRLLKERVSLVKKIICKSAKNRKHYPSCSSQAPRTRSYNFRTKVICEQKRCDKFFEEDDSCETDHIEEKTKFFEQRENTDTEENVRMLKQDNDNTTDNNQQEDGSDSSIEKELVRNDDFLDSAICGDEQKSEDEITYKHVKQSTSLETGRPKKKRNSRNFSNTLRKQPKDSKQTRSFICHICNEVVGDQLEFQRHYREKHPDEKKYTCKFCHRNFKTLHNVNEHQRSHAGEKPFSCHYCSKRFTTKKSMKSHVKCFHEKESISQLFPCDKCDKTFVTLPRLQIHLETHRDLVVVCKACGEALKSSKTFDRHNKRRHDGKAECSLPVNPNGNKKECENSALNSNLKCHVCWNYIYGKKGVKSHFEAVHPGLNPNKCTQCGKTFPNYSDCRKHAMRHSSDFKPIQCDQCPMRFFTNTELKIHGLTHIPESERTKYICETCGSAFSSKSNYCAHIKKHERGNSSLVCEICGKSYSDKGYAQHKKAVHSTSRPHKCSHCIRTFTSYSDLNKHVRSHTKQKPYKCPFCDKHFPYSSSRARHVREVHHRKGHYKEGTSETNVNDSSGLGLTQEDEAVLFPDASSHVGANVILGESDIAAVHQSDNLTLDSLQEHQHSETEKDTNSDSMERKEVLSEVPVFIVGV